jgi:hypothetical protein
MGQIISLYSGYLEGFACHLSTSHLDCHPVRRILLVPRSCNAIDLSKVEGIEEVKFEVRRNNTVVLAR